jgi:hypothetical protein
MVTIALAAPALAGDEPGASTESVYFPNKVGTTWTYSVGEKKITAKIAKHEKMGDYMCAVVETHIDGERVATEHVAVTKQGLLRVAYKDQRIEPPVMFLKFDAKPGESWEVDSKVGAETLKGKFTRGEEDVDMPGYKGKAVMVTGDFKVNDQPAKFVYWFAEKKGIVKQMMNLNGQDITLSLEKFEEGK